MLGGEKRYQTIIAGNIEEGQHTKPKKNVVTNKHRTIEESHVQEGLHSSRQQTRSKQAEK